MTTRKPRSTGVAGMAGVILVLHLVGWGSLSLLVVPEQLAVSNTQMFGIGLGLTAYILGMRHAQEDMVSQGKPANAKLNRRSLLLGTAGVAGAAATGGAWFAVGSDETSRRIGGIPGRSY